MDTLLFDQIGGEEGVRRLVDRFYDLMEQLPEARGIREMHPADTSGSREKLFMFLVGWTGGPALYMEKFGHPRLRARHLPFTIGESERDQWLMCFSWALDELGFSDEAKRTFRHSLGRLADHMRNQQSQTPG